MNSVSVFNDVKCAVARPLPSMIPIRAACFQRVPWIVGGRYRYLVHLISYLTRFRHSLFYVVAYASDSAGECDLQHCSLLTGSTSTLCSGLNLLSCPFVAVDFVAWLVSWLGPCVSHVG